MKTRKLLHIMPLLMSVALVGACAPADETEIDTTEGMETPGTPAPPPAEAAISRTLPFEPVPDAPTSITGTAIVTEESDGSTTVRVDLNGLPEGEHAWHVHSAPCGTDGPIVVAFTDTPDMQGLSNPLAADQSGHAEAEATVPADRLSAMQLSSGQYSLHVHQGNAETPGATIACVTLR